MLRGITICLLPVLLLLVILIRLDRLRLARMGIIVFCITMGVGVMLLCLGFSTAFISWFGVPFHRYVLLAAPVVEESMKLSFLAVLFARNRIGFMIDGAIYGFAVGTGFAVAENAFYLYWPSIRELYVHEMVVRGAGTAVMHGGTTALAGIMCAGGLNRSGRLFLTMIPALIVAVGLHFLFNFSEEPSLLTSMATFILFPFIIIGVFRLNERVIRRWLDSGFTSDVTLLMMIRKGQMTPSNAGKYLQSLSGHFSPLGLVDLYCYLDLSLELSTRARARIMMQEAGIIPPADPDRKGKLRELKALRRRIGLTGYLALAPLIQTGR
jgi:RsiW-degrading membrane proteinase PrsW (M82 family)